MFDSENMAYTNIFLSNNMIWILKNVSVSNFPAPSRLHFHLFELLAFVRIYIAGCYLIWAHKGTKRLSNL